MTKDWQANFSQMHIQDLMTVSELEVVKPTGECLHVFSVCLESRANHLGKDCFEFLVFIVAPPLGRVCFGAVPLNWCTASILLACRVPRGEYLTHTHLMPAVLSHTLPEVIHLGRVSAGLVVTYR